MTTIAWDGITLAGDTMVTRGNWKSTITSKVWIIGRGKKQVLYGGCGNIDDVLAVKAWLEGGDKPSPRDFSAMRVFRDGRVELLHESLFWHPWEAASPFAMGSGRDFALAAMMCGKNAEEAVAIAAKIDSGTAEPITSVRFA